MLHVWVVNSDTIILLCPFSDDSNEQLYSRYHSPVWPEVAVQLRDSTALLRVVGPLCFDLGEVALPARLI